MEIQIIDLYRLTDPYGDRLLIVGFWGAFCSGLALTMIAFFKVRSIRKTRISFFENPNLFAGQLAVFKEILSHWSGFLPAVIFLVNFILVLVYIMYLWVCDSLLFNRMEEYLMTPTDLSVFIDDSEVSAANKESIATSLLESKKSKHSGSRPVSNLIRLRLESGTKEKLHFRMFKDSRDSDLYWVTFTDDRYQKGFTARYAKMQLPALSE